jgi:hypothetical protein
MRPSADWIGRLLRKRMNLRGGPEGPPVFVAPGAPSNGSGTTGPAAAGAPDYPRQTLNLACSRCGYRLRGIAPESRCPECGQDVAETLAANERYRKRLFAVASRLKGPPLSRSDGGWMSRVASACFALAAVQAAFVLWDLHRRSMGWTAKSPDALLVALAAAYAWSLWRLTAPPRRADGADDPKHDRTRATLRALSLAPVVAAALAQVSELVDYRSHALFAQPARLIAFALALAAYFQFDYLGYLAARARDRWAVVVFRVARLAAPVWLAMSALAIRGGAVVPDMAAAAVSALYAYGGLGLVCFAIACFLILRVGARFRAAAKSARGPS